MRLLLDARAPFGGIGRHVRWLRRHLEERLAPAERVFYEGDPSVDPDGAPPRRGAVRASLGSLKRIAIDQVHLPLLAKRCRADLFHSPNYLVPHGISLPTVVDCYDLTLLDQFWTKKRGLVKYYERRVLLRALERARIIVVPSDAVRDELVDRFDLPADRVETIYPACQSWPPLPDERLLPPLARGPFFLSVGTLEPRKNLDLLLDAHRQVWSETRIPLLLVGPYGWRQGSLLRRLRRCPEQVRWLGWVEDAVLGALYTRATACVQVSLAEGFNLPALEAMSAGCPLVLSDLAVHREVAGPCALYAPTDGTSHVADQLRRTAAFDPEECRRSAERAKRRAAELAQRSGIDRYLAVYRRALDE